MLKPVHVQLKANFNVSVSSLLSRYFYFQWREYVARPALRPDVGKSQGKNVIVKDNMQEMEKPWWNSVPNRSYLFRHILLDSATQ